MYEAIEQTCWTTLEEAATYINNKQQVLLTSSRVDVRGWTAKISDFGLSRLLDTSSSHLHTRTHGTVMYAAPELLKDGRLTKAADVYSFALLGMLHMTHGLCCNDQ